MPCSSRTHHSPPLLYCTVLIYLTESSSTGEYNAALNIRLIENLSLPKPYWTDRFDLLRSDPIAIDHLFRQPDCRDTRRRRCRYSSSGYPIPDDADECLRIRIRYSTCGFVRYLCATVWNLSLSCCCCCSAISLSFFQFFVLRCIVLFCMCLLCAVPLPFQCSSCYNCRI